MTICCCLSLQGNEETKQKRGATNVILCEASCPFLVGKGFYDQLFLKAKPNEYRLHFTVNSIRSMARRIAVPTELNLDRRINTA
jgi:hypothetical protein